MSRSNFLAPDTLAIATCCGSVSLSLASEATKNSATASKGSIVAEIPILWTSDSITLSINARLKARCVPLLVGTKECISSITIHFMSFNSGLKRFDARAKPSDSGVVIRI